MLQRVALVLAGMALIPAAMHAQTPSECRRLAIETVQLTGAAHLPPEVQEKIATDLHGREYDQCSNWIGELEGRVLRAEAEAWPRREDEGYMDLAVGVEWKPLGRGPGLQFIAVAIRVYEGAQKLLRGIVFRTTGEYSVPPMVQPVLTVDELHGMIPLREGEAYRRDRLNAGLAAIARAYGAKGFVDCSITSQLEVDAENRGVTVLVDLDEGPRYRVGSVEVAGLDTATEAVLRAKLESGQAVNPAVIEKFFAANKAKLPPGASPQSVAWQRDKKRAVVDFSFDFRTATAGHE